MDDDEFGIYDVDDLSAYVATAPTWQEANRISIAMNAEHGLHFAEDDHMRRGAKFLYEPRGTTGHGSSKPRDVPHGNKVVFD